ncbi:MAG TPA: P1 family peptidase [Vicinamibacteria bacterium]
MRISPHPIVLTLAAGLGGTAGFAQPAASSGLTAVAGIKVGHHTLSERPTGCTVILTEAGAVAGVDVRGGAPGTRETDLLDPVNMVQKVHAIVLAGGSAFGLDAASGVMRYLEEKGVGFDAFVAKVPIVPAAILFDLGVGGSPKIRPTGECGYAAAQAATDGPVAEGSVGAGAGATVGKTGGPARSMKAGIGSAAIALPNGLVVAALVAVNAVGDIIDPATGHVVAGVRNADGKGFADARVLVRSGALGRRDPDFDRKKPGADATPRPGESTTIGVIATNAVLTKVEATKVAQMAHDGYARAISPVHTPGDGDTIFALATATLAGEGNAGLVGALAAEVMADAIVRAATQATGLPGIPAARDLQK